MAKSIVFILFIFQLFGSTIGAPTYLNLTAISAANGESILECWQLSDPFAVSGQAGTAGTAVHQLGNAVNTSIVVLPAQFNGGLHTAPAVQYVAFLSGLAHVTLPTSNQSAVVLGGEYGLIIAADTASISREGHFTDYPSNQETVALQIPTADGKVPNHRVLHQGPCVQSEQNL